jgi:glutathione peroxidase
MTTIGDFTARDITGAEVPLARFLGQVTLVVNTASKCGFTPQYQGLEKLQAELGPRGFTVLGFPCNQFGKQEPGSEAEIARFCRTSYDVKFPLFSKIDVNGPAAHPLYAWLKDKARGLFGSRKVKWNFTKFLVDRQGQVVARFAPATPPDKIRQRIEALL